MIKRRDNSNLINISEINKEEEKKVKQGKISKGGKGKSKTDYRNKLKMKSIGNNLIDEHSSVGNLKDYFEFDDCTESEFKFEGSTESEEKFVTEDFNEIDDYLADEPLLCSSFDEEQDCDYKDLNYNLEADRVYEKININTSVTFDDFYNRLMNKFPNISEDLKRNRDVLGAFFNKIQINNINFKDCEKEIFSIIDKYASSVGPNGNNKLSKNLLYEIFSHEPNIILGKNPSKNKLQVLLEDKETINKISKKLKKKLISEDRAKIALNLLRAFVVPQITCDKFSIPVLIGPPAGGKTYIPRVLTDVLNQFDLKVHFYVQDVAFDRGNNEDLEMTLLGIDKHWSTASPGILYNLSKEVDILIVVLDEIDKKQDRRVFLKLFDHERPLQDVFISGFCSNMNLRYKVAFICTGNENNFHYDDALKSRTTIIEVKPYTSKEKESIVKGFLTRELKDFSERHREIVYKHLMSLSLKNPNLDVRQLLALTAQLKCIIKYSLGDDKEIESEIKNFISSLDLIGFTQTSNLKKKIGFV